MGRSTASMLDGEDPDINAFSRGMSRDELGRRREKERTKELALAEKLGQKGKGAGSEYLRARSGKQTATGDDARQADAEEEPTASSLGLIRSASEVSLRAAANGKRKRDAGSSNNMSTPMGWGGAAKRGLLLSPKKDRPPSVADGRESSMSQREASPKKRARFLLQDKDIHEPGRESLGNVGVKMADHDDSDDLEII